jgi:hypothetical protein
MAGLFISPFAPAFALNGIIAPAATLTFYATGTSTPANVYADSGLITSLGSVVTANAQGQFVAIYLSPTQVYRVVLKTSSGSVLGDIDPVTESTLAQLAASTGASLVGFLPSGTGAVARTMQSKERDIINARDFGVVADGTTDDAAAMQNAINAADSQGALLLLPGAVIKVNTMLNLVGKYVDIRGVANKTTLRAGAAIASILDCSETVGVSYSPFSLRDMMLDGNSLVTNANFNLRYRRSYLIENIFSSNAPRGFRIKDGNTGILRNLRTSAVQYGLHSEGSNHQTHHDSCAFIGASNVGLLVEANGTAADGNHGLTFTGCLAQSGAGRAIELNFGTEIDWNGGYIGEAIGGYVIDNKGGVFTMRGGVAFFDYGAGTYLVHPVGVASGAGTTRFLGTRLAASNTNGLQKLATITAPELATGFNGKVSFEDVDIYSLSAGGGAFTGDLLDYGRGPSRSLCARNGATWTAATSGGAGFTNTIGAGVFANDRTVTCTAVSPPTIIGFSTPLLSTDWRLGEPLFFVMCYSSTKPLVVRTGTGVLTGGGVTIGAAPATSGIATWISFEVNPNVLASGIIEMFVNGTAVNGDTCTLRRAGLADSSFLNRKAGVASNVFYP